MVVGDGGATRGGTFNGWKNLHNTRLTYTPPPPSIQISPVNRLCARQTPKLRTGRTLSMAPVAIFFVRDAQMHRAFDNWSGTNDISFARCVAYAFYKLSDCQTVADSKGHCYKSRNYRDRVTQSLYIYVWSRNISKKSGSSFATSQWKFLSNLANYAVTFARQELEKRISTPLRETIDPTYRSKLIDKSSKRGRMSRL